MKEMVIIASENFLFMIIHSRWRDVHVSVLESRSLQKQEIVLGGISPLKQQNPNLGFLLSTERKILQQIWVRFLTILMCLFHVGVTCHAVVVPEPCVNLASVNIQMSTRLSGQSIQLKQKLENSTSFLYNAYFHSFPQGNCIFSSQTMI